MCSKLHPSNSCALKESGSQPIRTLLKMEQQFSWWTLRACSITSTTAAGRIQNFFTWPVCCRQPWYEPQKIHFLDNFFKTFYSSNLFVTCFQIVNTKQHLDSSLTNLIAALTARLRSATATNFGNYSWFHSANKRWLDYFFIGKKSETSGKLLQDIIFLVRDYHLNQKDGMKYLKVSAHWIF